MAGSVRAETAVADEATARSGEGVRERYHDALAALARTAAAGELTPALLAPLYTLNATFYLEAYLPAREHSAAVASAARALEAACVAAIPRQTPNATPTARAGHDLSRQRSHHGVTLLRAGFVALEASGGAPAGVIALQHALEVVPVLGRTQHRALLAATVRWLRTLPAAPATWWGAPLAQRERMAAWAANNARPARTGEVAAWARCLLTAEPARLLEQALASGLRFDDLLDGLSVAAAARLLANPADPAGLIGAHAARRLSEIDGAPALAAWLGVAASLSGETPGGPGLPTTAPPSARALALAALHAPRSGAAQLAEAALMEAESLPAALRDRPLHALAAWLGAGGQTTAAAGQHTAL